VIILQRLVSNNAQNLAGPVDVGAVASTPLIPGGWEAEIKAINCRDHLRGFKRTQGGLGSAKYDQRQKTLDQFFQEPGSG
jgi:hypothetical protein